jgi:hypothetical protein
VFLEGFQPTHGERIAGLTVRASGHVLKRISAPRHTPRVKLSKPNVRPGATYLTLRWRTFDPDPVRRTVFVALALGRHRFRTIWTGYDRGVAHIPTTSLHSRHLRLQVTVSDGFHFGLAYLNLTLPRHFAAALQANDQGGWRQELSLLGIKVPG